MDDRQIIELYNERSETAISEIADDYEISEGKVKMALHRIRNKLKQTLEKEGIVL